MPLLQRLVSEKKRRNLRIKRKMCTAISKFKSSLKLKSLYLDGHSFRSDFDTFAAREENTFKLKKKNISSIE